MDNSEPSICIPRSHNNIMKKTVKDNFEKIFGIDSVERIDIVNQSNFDTKYCKIFVHFRYWSNDPEIYAIRERLLSGNNIKIVYDAPWFWKCSASRFSKPIINRYTQSSYKLQ